MTTSEGIYKIALAHTPVASVSRTRRRPPALQPPSPETPVLRPTERNHSKVLMPYPVTAVLRPSRRSRPCVRRSVRTSEHVAYQRLGYNPGVGGVCDAFSHSAGARETIKAHLDDVPGVASRTTQLVQFKRRLTESAPSPAGCGGGGDSGWNWTRVKTVPSARDRGCLCHSTLFAEGERARGRLGPLGLLEECARSLYYAIEA